jgi:hypothetical protein
MRFTALLCALSAASLLPAQTIDTIGGMGSAPITANISKSSLFRVDSSQLLFTFEMYMSIPGPDTLTWFAYRNPQRNGNATLEWTLAMPVTGGGGPQWYSTGPMALPLVCNNYYLIGVAWSQSVTYYFNVVNAGAPVSFGTWERAMTITPPMPPTVSITGSDIAQYYQRLTTFPINGVGCVGTGCGTVPPRLVASTVPGLGTTVNLHITNGQPSALGVYAFTIGPTLATPVPLFGCQTWLNLGGGVITNGIVLDSSGFGTLPLAIPNNPLYAGTLLSLQAGTLSSVIALSNALDLSF